MEKKAEVAIVLPMYNPYDAWEVDLERSLATMVGILKDHQVKFILVNDGSTKDVEHQIQLLKTKPYDLTYVPYIQNQGKGHAIRTGLSQAQADYYIYTDYDFPFGEQILASLLDELEKNAADLVIANRTQSYYAQLPFTRNLISRSLRVISWFILSFKSYDTQAGLKGMNEAAKAAFLDTKISSFIFEVEFIKLAIKNKLKISKIDVEVKPELRLSNFGFKVIKRELNHLIELIIDGR